MNPVSEDICVDYPGLLTVQTVNPVIQQVNRSCKPTDSDLYLNGIVAMNISDKKLHNYGFLITALFFCVFFLMEMFFSTWDISRLPLKVTIISIFFTAGVFEPTHWVIMAIRKRKKDVKQTWARIRTAMLILTPWIIAFAFLRVWIEDYTLIWGRKIDFSWYYMWTAGTAMLFMLLQIAIYEGIYFFKQWRTSILEAEELKRLNLETQFDALKVQIQPHFLFNSLNTLVALAEFNPPKAVLFTKELARMYRYFLDVSGKQFISLEDELEFTRTYLSLLKTRYDEGLFMEIIPADDLDEYALPPLSLQLLVENAIKHNVISQHHPLHIQISFDFEQNTITVKNNLQPKKNIIKTGAGLAHLKKKFQLLGLPDVVVCQDALSKEFTVTVPFAARAEHTEHLTAPLNISTN